MNPHAGATAFFVVLPLSEQIQLECAFPQGITNVEWLNNSANFEILPPERNNTAIISLVVNEDTHGNNFRCRGLDQSGQAVYKQYRIIARGKKWNQVSRHRGTVSLRDDLRSSLVEAKMPV